MAALCLLTLLTGCAGSGVKDLIPRDIPPPPAYAQQVQVPEPKAGESCYLVAGRERAGRLKANRIIRGWLKDAERTRSTMAGGRP
jgi:hypothetical protein